MTPFLLAMLTVISGHQTGTEEREYIGFFDDATPEDSGIKKDDEISFCEDIFRVKELKNGLMILIKIKEA